MLFLISLFTFTSNAQIQEINPIVGNTSWQDLHPKKEILIATERERISSHLNYVLQILKNSPATKPSLQNQRNLNIDLLADYIKLAEFPRDVDYHPERRPCFIDHSGNICAVGYLLEKTKSREEAERINTIYQYEYLLEMKDTALLKWQKQSGLSLRELAMIQPTYRIAPPRRSIFYDEKKKKYGTRDVSGKVLIKAKYDAIELGSYSQNLVQGGLGTEIVKLKDKWAILNSEGKKLTEFKFDKIVGSNSLVKPENIGVNYESDPSNEYLFAYQAKDLSVYDGKGSFLFQLSNSEITNYYAIVFEIKQNGLYGLFDQSGKAILPVEYDEIKVYQKSLLPCLIGRIGERSKKEPIIAIRIKKRGLYSLLNPEMKVVFPLKYQSIRHLASQLWQLEIENKKYLYSLDGRKIGDAPVQELKSIGDCSQQNLRVKSNSKFGLLNADLEWVLPPEYDYIEASYTFIEFRKDGLAGYLNPDGSIFLDREYDYIHRRSDASFFVSKNNLKGKLDAKGKVLIPVKYKNLTKLYHDEIMVDNYCYYAAEEWGQYRIISHTGQQIGNQIFDSVLHVGRNSFRVKMAGLWYFGKYSNAALVFLKDLAVEDFKWVSPGYYAYQQNGKYGLWETQFLIEGKGKLFEAKYDEILDIKFDNYQRFLIQHNGKYGIIDQKGEIIIPPEYDYFLEMKYSYNSNQGMALKKAEQWYYYSLRKDEIKLAPKNLLPRIRKLMVKPRE